MQIPVRHVEWLCRNKPDLLAPFMSAGKLDPQTNAFQIPHGEYERFKAMANGTAAAVAPVKPPPAAPPKPRPKLTSQQIAAQQQRLFNLLPPDKQAAATRHAAICKTCDQNNGLRLLTVKCKNCGCAGLSLATGTCKLGKWDTATLDTFDRVVFVNLDRRPDRLQTFTDRLPSDWPFRKPERFAAVDGQQDKPPSWWRAGAGAWGIHQSHVRILDQALKDGINSVLILEDDAVCDAGFTAKVRALLDRVPPDWHHLYLGGQHLKQDIKRPEPVPGHDGWVRCFNVNRCHAHALRGDYIRAAYLHLTDYAALRKQHADKTVKPHHVDHHFGTLHETQKWNTYAPSEWLIGQCDGKSNICGKDLPTRFWNAQKQPPPEAKGIAVKRKKYLITGHPRSGTKYMARLMQSFGQQVWHEHMARDGISSWMLAVDADKVPYGDGTIRRNFEFEKVLLVVRHPLKVLASAMQTEAKASLEFRRKFTDPPKDYNDHEEAVHILLEWDRLASLLNPAVIHAETAEDEVKLACGFKEPLRPPPEKTVNKREHAPLAWSDLRAKLRPELTARLEAYARKYGYNLDDQDGKPGAVAGVHVAVSDDDREDAGGDTTVDMNGVEDDQKPDDGPDMLDEDAEWVAENAPVSLPFACADPKHKSIADCRRAISFRRYDPMAPLESHKCLMARLKVGIIRLRRAKVKRDGMARFKAAETWPAFKADVEGNLPYLLQSLNSRWLVSLLDTYADYGTADERRNALLIVLMLTWDRFIAAADGMQGPRKAFTPLWDGLTVMGTGRGADAHRNLFRRIGSVMADTPVIKSMLVELYNRAARQERFGLNRLRKVSERDVVAESAVVANIPLCSPSPAPSPVAVQPSQYDLTVLTPTGDRQAQLDLCQRWMQRQTFQGTVQWVIVDDGKEPSKIGFKRDGWTIEYIRRQPRPSDPPHTLALNLKTAVPHVKADKIAIVEDDDWYNPEYLTTMSQWLDGADLAGQGRSVCLHVEHMKWLRCGNTNHASLCKTGLRRSVLPTLMKVCQRHKWNVDHRLWKLFGGKKRVYDPTDDEVPLAIGIKGMYGRRGLTHSHKADDPRYTRHSSDRIAGWMGSDLDVYGVDRRPVVYTAIIGGYDTLKQPVVNTAWRYVCITDQAIADPGVWEIRKVERTQKDATREARRWKALSHEAFPGAPMTLWIDGAARLIRDPQSVVDDMLAKHSCDIVTLRHPERSCVYDEAEACKQMKKDDPRLIDAQMDRYRKDGYPTGAGLVETRAVLRKHTDAVKRFNEAWWGEIKAGSRRDQLSFNYVARRTGVAFGAMDAPREGYKYTREMFLELAPHTGDKGNSPKRRLVTVPVKFGRMTVPIHTHLTQQLWKHGGYELEMLKVIAGMLAPGDLVLDVGACVGTCAVYLATHGARVIAIEPVQGDLLERNVRQNSVQDRVRIVRAAASGAAARMQITNHGCDLGQHRLEVCDGGDIAALTLDDIVAAGEVPKVIKIDVEGGELGVIAGASRLLRSHPTLFVEAFQPEPVDAALAVYGYTRRERYNASPTYRYSVDAKP